MGVLQRRELQNVIGGRIEAWEENRYTDIQFGNT